MIRRAFVEHLPALLALGIKPADLEEMWPAELYQLIGIVSAQSGGDRG